MTDESRALNFNPGPAALPLAVLERAREELVDFAGTGMSIMEHSHRGATYEAVHNQAISLLRELLGIPEHFDVLFLHGGASQQFAQVPLNLLAPGSSADYVVTGSWGEKAVSEAEAVALMTEARIRVSATTAVTAEGDGKSATYSRVPRREEIQHDPLAAYVHVTSNETIHGIQFPAALPDLGGTPVVCDMSSDFLSRKIDISRFGMIYAGAQKNVGPSGVTVVVARKDLVKSARSDIPTIFQYRTFAENNSLYNTPPTFSIYLMKCVLEWVRDSGGLEQIQRWNAEKASMVYGAIDRHADFYRCPVERDSRSQMNVVFRLPSEADEKRFLAEAERRGMIGLKGHRSTGGVRVSLYNAIPVEWASALADLMEDFVRDA
ncbi:MAG TPA: 3-phosphoserine/phosphohydroxythreonine transaminase [Chloroflexota bacterium]|nr:3-phosphoserine/phosphohydroxythreonine transaminase [Chloroflexota bacterium]